MAGKPKKNSAKIKTFKINAKNVKALGAVLAEFAGASTGNPPTTGTAKETGRKGGDKAPDDASPDFDTD